MANFDAKGLDITQYTLDIPIDACRFQNTVEDFMKLVETNPDYLMVNNQLIDDFCRLIDDDEGFPLAAMVMPELRLPQSHDTAATTVTNIILRKPEIKRRRPAPPISDPGITEGKKLVY